MISVYKRVDRTKENLTGVEEINDVTELNKPILLCLSAQDFHDKSVFGIIREGMMGARLLTSQEPACRFKTDGFPVDFLGVKYKLDKEHKKHQEIVDKIILPILLRGIDKEDIKRQARKINVMTYCDGTYTYKMMEEYLTQRLLEIGLTIEDIKDILSQISVTAIGTMVDTSSLMATTATFVDINDTEIATERSDFYKELLDKNNCKSVYGYLKNKNNILYVYDGNGNHSLKEYFKNDCLVKPALCGVLSMFLENSVLSVNDPNVNLSSQDISNRLKKYYSEEKTPQEMMENIDSSLSYDGAYKYSIEEANLRMDLDDSYRMQVKMGKLIEGLTLEQQRQKTKIDDVIKYLREYSSDTTFHQVLISAGLFQASNDRDVFTEISDKEIREKYDKLNKPDTGLKM